MTKAARIIQAIGAVVGWFAVITQLYLIITNRNASVGETIVRFFSFYTILTNILVALCLTCSLFASQTTAGKFFSRYSTITAITLYILVVGIVYNLVLRSLWQPEGMQKIVDELLHSFIPLWFVIYWLTVRPRTRLHWRQSFTWLIYPLVYTVFILIRGKLSGFYPYPFIDVKNLGFGQVLLNSFYLFLTFLFIAFILQAIARQLAVKNS